MASHCLDDGVLERKQQFLTGLLDCEVQVIALEHRRWPARLRNLDVFGTHRVPDEESALVKVRAHTNPSGQRAGLIVSGNGRTHPTRIPPSRAARSALAPGQACAGGWRASGRAAAGSAPSPARQRRCLHARYAGGRLRQRTLRCPLPYTRRRARGTPRATWQAAPAHPPWARRVRERESGSGKREGERRRGGG
eukprot:scaffold258408_cov31-Tisochrysis_lutea.AAC.4